MTAAGGVRGIRLDDRARTEPDLSARANADRPVFRNPRRTNDKGRSRDRPLEDGCPHCPEDSRTAYFVVVGFVFDATVPLVPFAAAIALSLVAFASFLHADLSAPFWSSHFCFATS